MEFAFAPICDYDTGASSPSSSLFASWDGGRRGVPAAEGEDNRAETMSPQLRHWLEKVQVQATAAVAFAVMWFMCWPLVRPWDPQGALAFIPAGNYAGFAVFAALMLALAAACALLTLPARPEGALLAVLVGAAGLSLHSGPMRTLLWEFQDSPQRLFTRLAIEALLMAAVLVAAVVVILLIRGAFRRLVPRWVWGEPAEPAAARGEQGNAPSRSSQSAGATAARAGACLLMEMAAATVLLVLTFRSPDRGQVAFALAGSFFLSALIAHQTFPARTAAACWLGPAIMAVAVFAVGALAASYPDKPTWHAALMVAQRLPLRAALPVDWLSLGGAGAVAGYWLSRRFHYARTHHKQEEQQVK